MLKQLKDFDVYDKRILVRCDFNVPLDEEGNISDDYRIKKTIPTIKYLIDRKAKVVLMSHLGEPEGKIVEELRLNKVAEKISDYLNMTIEKEDDCIGPEVEGQVNKLQGGQVLLLENLRFHKEETDNDKDFAKKLSYLGDLYVNDAFGVCHRDHASVTGVPNYLPHCAGLLLAKEIESLDMIMGKSLPGGRQAEKPMTAIVGGKKVETKSKFINKISTVADTVIISGLLKKEVQEKNIQLLNPEKIIGPVDKLDALDISEESIKIFSEKILQSKTVLWNGPFGKFEDAEYAKGSLSIAKAIIDSGAYSVVGGGETVEFLTKQGIIEKFSHVSTGGGAMLNYLSGDKLPGIESLNQ
jgi:phosphoglycerate kinase